MVVSEWIAAMGEFVEPENAIMISLDDLAPAGADRVDSTLQITTVRTAFSPAASVVPGAGTWKVGGCVFWNASTVSLTNNDFVNGWVHVSN